MVNPYAPPGESSFDLFTERTIIDGLFLGAIAFGVHLTLFIWCFQLLIQKKSKTRVDYFYLVYIVLLFIMGNIGNATNIKVGEATFVDNRNYPGGVVAFFSSGAGPVGLTCNVVYIINTWFQDGMLLYRFYMFFSQIGWWVMILPTIMFLASVALSLMLIVMLCVPGTTLWSTISINLAIPYWSISIALNIIITAAISILLLYMRYRIRQAHVGSGSVYNSITAMLVESAMIYTVNGLIFLIAYAVNSPIQNIFLPVLGQTQSIAPLLIVLRVLRGEGWSSSTVSNFYTQHASTEKTVIATHHSGSTLNAARDDLNVINTEVV